MTFNLVAIMRINHMIILSLEFCYLRCSDFVNIFDVDWFISSLAKDVTIVKRVPDKVMRSMEKPPYTMRVPRKSTPEYYLDQVLPILLRRRVRRCGSFVWFMLFYSIKFCTLLDLPLWVLENRDTLLNDTASDPLKLSRHSFRWL